MRRPVLTSLLIAAAAVIAFAIFTDRRADLREAAIEALKEAVKADSLEDITSKTQTLTELSGQLAQKAYAESAEAGGAGEGGEQAQPADDDVVDAEFEEVKDDKK